MFPRKPWSNDQLVLMFKNHEHQFRANLAIFYGIIRFCWLPVCSKARSGHTVFFLHLSLLIALFQNEHLSPIPKLNFMSKPWNLTLIEKYVIQLSSVKFSSILSIFPVYIHKSWYFPQRCKPFFFIYLINQVKILSGCNNLSWKGEIFQI